MSKTNIQPLLYYSYVLQKCKPEDQFEIKFDLDHIIPQTLFNADSGFINQNLKDSLANYAILPKKDNISKKDKRLNEITDIWLKESVSKYTSIDVQDFDKFSDLTNLDALLEMRLNLFDKLFTEERKKRLINV